MTGIKKFRQKKQNNEYQNETTEIDKTDILALIIAAAEILLPIVIGFVLVFAAAVFLLTKIFS